MAHPPQPASQLLPIQAVVATLTPEEWLLVRLRDELYDGQWEEMQTDLEGRLNGQPYIFKLVNRIQDDLKRMHRLRSLEAELRVNFAAYLPKEPA
jgi:hypothetical protein